MGNRTNFTLIQFGVNSNYKADMYETWQLWFKKVIERICFSVSIYSLVFKLHKFKVAPSPNCGLKFAVFLALQMLTQQIGPLGSTL